MTAHQPAHGRPHTRFARACDRLSRGLAWVYEAPRRATHATAGLPARASAWRREHRWAELTDDNGEDISDVMEAVPHGTCDWGDCDQIAVDQRWDDEHGWLPVCRTHTNDVPRSGASAQRGVMPEAGNVSDPGAGYFHDEPTVLQAVLLRDGTLLRKTPGEPAAYDPREIDDTIVNLRPEPRSGATAWATQLRSDRQAHRPPPAWVQRILTAPIADIHRALAAPDPDMYLWNASQQRALAAA